MSLNSRIAAELLGWKSRLPKKWRLHVANVELDFDDIDPKATLQSNERIWPQETNDGRPTGAHLFKAFRDVASEEVRVVVFGNDPYTHLEQATGRSFEQGNLSNWKRDILDPNVRFSPSLKTILAAALETSKSAKHFPLVDKRVVFDPSQFKYIPKSKWGKWNYGRSPEWVAHLALEIVLANGLVKLPSPKQIFGYWAKQGVLWANRTLTFTKWETDVSKPGHRRSHQKLWAPFTDRVIETLVSNASKQRPIVFALWGSEAKEIGKIVKKKAKKFKTTKFVKFCETGHPQRPENYFLSKGKLINPLDEINKLIKGKPINWT